MDETARSAWWHRWTSWLGLALGVGVVAGMVRHAGAASIVATLQIAGAGVLWVLLVPLVIFQGLLGMWTVTGYQGEDTDAPLVLGASLTLPPGQHVITVTATNSAGTGPASAASS